MKVTSRSLFVLGFLIIYITTIDALSVLQNDESSSISNSYRHRLESNFPLLRWNVTFSNKPKPTPKPPSVRKTNRS
jgi:hypothetical protein